jgi:predicted DNA-binding transcriptional regulator YafY
LRSGYRDFRIDFIESLKNSGEVFDARSLFTLKEYFNSLAKKHEDMQKVVVSFEQAFSRYVKNTRYYYGYVSEELAGDRCHMTFLVGNMRSFCRWLMSYGTVVEIESPDKLKETMEEMVEELAHHYSAAVLK